MSRFDAIDDVPVPDQWDEINRRGHDRTIEERRVPAPPRGPAAGRSGHGRRGPRRGRRRGGRHPLDGGRRGGGGGRPAADRS